VRVGQVLALLGNSGNSDAPHLHFQLVDANSPFGSEGIPYELETFTEVGVVADSEALDAGQAWRPKPGERPVDHRREFPADQAVLIFP
jgi:murein DD-endopeptidase MepM/ murein hydrolase activator NlpD